MNASDVSEDGYYWTKACGVWNVVAFADGYFHYWDGSLEPQSAMHHDFEVIGPIEPPFQLSGTPTHWRLA